MHTVTLTILGHPLTFTSRLQACLHPGEVHPGPCPGGGKGGGLKTIAKKAVAPKKAAPKTPGSKTRKITPQQAAEVQQQMLQAEPWTDTQRTALHHYTDHGFVTMNGMLRGESRHPDPDPAKTREDIRSAYHAMRPLPEPVRVFRTTRTRRLGLEETKNRAKFLAGLRGLIGNTHQDRGFTSATIDEHSGEFDLFGDVRLDIELPTGTRAAYVEEITQNPGEHEMVIAPGLKVQFISLDETKNPPILKARAIL
jgi:hypothetical protein